MATTLQTPVNLPNQTADGIFRSRVFPGLWLDPAALLVRDVATVLKVLQQGIASPEHAEFVKPRA